VHSINDEIKPKLMSLKKEINDSDKELIEIKKKQEILIKEIGALRLEINNRDSDLTKLISINDRKDQKRNYCILER